MRLSFMRAASFVLVFAILVAGCGDETTFGADSISSDTPEMMAAALVELVTEEHTFGAGPAPFTEYLIQTQIDPSAADPAASDEGPDRPLTNEEREAIENAVSTLSPVRWIDNPSDFQTGDLVPTIEGAAILGVGEPTIDGDTGLVPVSMWCGGLCGTWLTYRLDLINDIWTVTGIEGPIAVS